MRLQLMTDARVLTSLVLAVLCGLGAHARADGSLSMRGVYYKERATRVMQPMLDATFDVGEHGVVTAHGLVDAITSASASSGAVDAEPFSEKRYESGIGYAHKLDSLTLGAQAKYSTESDYESTYFGARAQLELFQKNTVVGLGGGIGSDKISAGATQGPAMLTLRCDAERPEEQSCPLDTYAVYASVSQIVSPNAVIGVSVDLAWLDGLQSNPYRSAIAGSVLVPERHPSERMRQAYAANARYYLDQTKTTLIGAYRYYRDDWNIHAHTPELRVVQEVGYDVDAALGYRYYTQDGAYFFRDRYPMDDVDKTQFVSDDIKLSTFDGHTFEAKLGVFGQAFDLEGKWSEARVEAILQYAIQNNRFGNAVIAHVALTIPFAY